MDTVHPNAPLLARGVIHVDTPLAADEATSVSNELLRRHALSFTARGLAGYVQSLPDGEDITVRKLAKESKEGELRVAAALRELERAGYLLREKVRGPDGRLTTRTTWFNVPRGEANPEPDPEPDPDPDPDPGPKPESDPKPESKPEAVAKRTTPPPPPPPLPVPASVPAPLPPAFVPAPAPAAPAAPAERSVLLLQELCRHDPRLTLSARDAERLAPGVERWFERGLSAEAITHALAARLPEPLTNPGGLLAHRLARFQPPQPAYAPPPAPVPPQEQWQEPGRWGMRIHDVPIYDSCDACERALPVAYAKAHGRCRDCQERGEGTAA